MHDHDKLYIGGEWVGPAGSGTIEVIDPSTEVVVGRVPEGTADDVDAAVAAARAAFDGWAATSPQDRAALVGRLGELLAADIDDMAALIASEVGMPIGLSKRAQSGLPAGVTASIAKIALDFPFEERIGSSLVVKEPVGVVGCITPWNYPLHQIMAKVAPALVAGCTVVVKPSEVAPLSAFRLAELVYEAGFPAGVFNLVTGFGPVVGEAIAAHPDVDMVSFTGSTRAGTRVAEVAAPSAKRVHQEMGGKSANIILEDADIDSAVKRSVMACYLNSGQTCTAHTRLLVPEARRDEIVEKMKAAVEATPVGAATDEGAMLGPLVSEVQWDRVQGYIQQGIDEGATLVTGGTGKPEGHEVGYFVKPTVFADVSNDMTIAQEEIFGPVLSIIGYGNEQEAVDIANDSPYGLSGGVWSSDEDHAVAVARQIRTGQVSINGGGLNIEAPFGGYKKSGNGRELGHYGIEEFLEAKALNF